MAIQDAKTVSDETKKGGKEKLLKEINKYLNYGRQSIRLEGSNRLTINSRIGKVIPKGDNKWEKGKLICIGASKDMSELMRMVRAIASMS